jgi:hypothetical protein
MLPSHEPSHYRASRIHRRRRGARAGCVLELANADPDANPIADANADIGAAA